MNLTTNMKNNFNALIAIALNTSYTNINILKSDILGDVFILSFERKISLNHLKKLNKYFGTDIRKEKIPYSLIINKKLNSIKLHIEGITHAQISLLDEINKEQEILNNLADKYDEQISNRLINYSEFLYETIYPTDTDELEWTFYYFARDKSHIGFANKDLQSDKSFKILSRDFEHFNTQKIPSFYDNIYRYVGTVNDARVMCLRRNYNSTHGSNWKYCMHGTPINLLELN